MYLNNQDGEIYIKKDSVAVLPALGYYETTSYSGQKIKDNPISKEVIASWKEFDGKEAVMLNGKYSSVSYDTPFLGIKIMDELPEFTNDVKTVKLASNEATWYRIGDEACDRTITVERPTNSAVYVYNKYKDIVYSTHINNMSNEISLPQGGYIVFLGETGGEITIH